MSERVHGGVDGRALRARGIDPARVVDFSVNLNPYGPCAALLRAVREAPLDRYPDPHAHEAREAWAAALDRTPAQIAVGHGAASMFWAIARALLVAGDRVVIAEPTFSELRVAAAAMGARLVRPRSDALRLDLESVVRDIEAHGARLLYLCTPNNPTGEYLSPARVHALAERCPHTTVVLDQSFLALSDHASDARVTLPDNVLTVRSLTKEFACPGLRIGLCVGAPALIARIESVRPTWPTSAPALAAIAVSAREGDFVRDSWRRMRDDRDALAEALIARGFAPLSSATGYQLVPLEVEAAWLQARLLEHGVLVRDCTSFGLARHVRLAALPEAARARLCDALDAVRRAR